MAAQVADRFDLGPDARLEVEAARGEQGQVRRLVTARGPFAVKESFDSVDAEEAQRTAEFQVACHDAAGVPCPRPLPDIHGRYLTEIGGLPIRVQTWADVDDSRHDARPGAGLHRGGTMAPADVPAAEPVHWVGNRPRRTDRVAGPRQGRKGAGAPFASRLEELVPACSRRRSC